MSGQEIKEVTEEQLSDDVKQAQKTLKKAKNYERLRFVMSIISTACIVIITLVVLGLAKNIEGKVQAIYDSAMISLNKMETVTEEINNADLAGTVENINDLAVQATSDLGDTMEKVNSIDMEALNDAIGRLDSTVTALDNAVSGFTRLFGG